MNSVYLISSVMPKGREFCKVYYAQPGNPDRAFLWYDRPEMATHFDRHLDAYAELDKVAVKDVAYQIEEMFIKE